MRREERRRRRSSNTTSALRYQLDACTSRLEGIVLSDEDGLCLAAAGDGRACSEVAARLPLIGRKVKNFEGVLLASDSGWEVLMRRVRVPDGDLYLAAIGGKAEQRKRQLGRSQRGVTRILSS